VIYLDNNATTRPSPGVVEAVAGALEEYWPNPSSVHRAGQAVRQQVELARRDIGALINAPAREIFFTSGGTESIHLAIRGVLGRSVSRSDIPPIVVSSRTEHAAVRDLLEDLEKRRQATVRWVTVARDGLVDLASLPQLLQGASLCSIQWANNETGAIQPIQAIAAACREHRVPFHCDATQWVGKEPTEAQTAGPDLLTFAAHKFHGPKGVGILWSRRGLALAPQIHGSQELGRRGGTENVPGILGAGVAAREARAWLASRSAPALAALRDRFERAVLAAIPDTAVNGPSDPALRLWNTTNLGFPRLEAEALLLLLSERGLCASAGAACSSGSLEPSPVLLAMGIPPEVAHGSLRFSLSRHTTEAEIDEAAGIVIDAAMTLRRTLPIAS
jgi:cysteine desulfurase